MSRNAEIAALFDELADRLDAQDDPYRPRAYRRAADNIRALPADIEAVAEEGATALEEIDGVGEAISSKILEYLDTGEIDALEAARRDIPVDIVALTRVEGVGPKTIGELYEALGVTDLDELEAAAKAGRIQEVPGFGEKTEANILENIPFARQSRERTLLAEARPMAAELIDHLLAGEGVERAEPAGSLRRWRETVGDVDVLATGPEPSAVMDRLTDWPAVDDVIEAGTAKASVRARGLRVDLRVVDPSEFGSALQYFTGSWDHNVALRTLAQRRDLKVNEYGVFDVADVSDPDDGQRVGKRIAGETEESVYGALDLPWIPPELREDTGELEAAVEGALPTLITDADVTGDLHVHTDRSDGDASLEAMVEAAEAAGFEYVGIADHATGSGMVGGVGLDEAALCDLAEDARALDETVDITVFGGVEANIDDEGGLSVSDDVLETMDLVVASAHSSLDGDGTERLMEAIEHPEVDVLGHPSGRLLNRRPGLEIDVEALGEAAANHGVALEVNANPARLDLWGEAVRSALDAGATIAINTDAHRPAEFDHITFGVHMARRGWAEPADVLTTGTAEAVARFLS